MNGLDTEAEADQVELNASAIVFWAEIVCGNEFHVSNIREELFIPGVSTVI